MVEGARLESVYTARYPGFESQSLRQNIMRTQARVAAGFSACSDASGRAAVPVRRRRRISVSPPDCATNMPWLRLAGQNHETGLNTSQVQQTG